MGNSNYKSENIEKNYFDNMEKNQFLRVKNSLSELEKDFIEMKNRQLKDKEAKIKTDI